jgi:phosphatidylglycerophosphate synthase
MTASSERSGWATDIRSILRRAIAVHGANLLSASRFILAGLWLCAFHSGYGPGILGPVSLASAASDFFDGRVARWTESVDTFGRWLDSFADVAFVLTVLVCEAYAGAIAAYLPVLIAASFSQYALDSTMISQSSAPVRSRLGHWGGVINFALAIALSVKLVSSLLARLIKELSPFLALFYLAAMFERAIHYVPLGAAGKSRPAH